MHVLSTCVLGITAITMANTIAGEETVHKLASLLLIVLGGSYILLFLSGKGGHTHSHNQPMEKMAVAGLVLVPALSPCATTLPVFLAVGNSSSMMILAVIVLLVRYLQPVHFSFDVKYSSISMLIDLQHIFGVCYCSLAIHCPFIHRLHLCSTREEFGWKFHFC